MQAQEFLGEITINWPLLFGCGTQLYNGREEDTTSTSVQLEPKNDWCKCTCHSQALSTKPDICELDRNLNQLTATIWLWNSIIQKQSRAGDAAFTLLHHEPKNDWCQWTL